MNLGDKSKAITAEDLIRRYNLENLKNDRNTISKNRAGLTKTDAILNNFIDTTTDRLQDLQNQVDGNITTWFFPGIPTLLNEPAVNWTTDVEKVNHLGDLYYDQSTGYAYRFQLSGNQYLWYKLTDSDVTQALAVANAAKDTADSKRRIFVTTPTTPYDVGDIWIDNDTDLYRCRASRASGVYSNTDWIRATDYTNDDYAKSVEAVLDELQTTVETNYVTHAKLETEADKITSEVTSTTSSMITEATNPLMTRSEFTSYTQTVTQELTDRYSKTEIKQIADGTFVDSDGNPVQVSKVVTESGAFSNEGLRIQKEDGNGNVISETSGLFNEKGVDITATESGDTILYAGYDDDPTSSTYGTSVVITDNLKVNTYLRCGGVGRFEPYENGVGFFLEG